MRGWRSSGSRYRAPRDLDAVSKRFPEFERGERGLTVRDPDNLAITFELLGRRLLTS